MQRPSEYSRKLNWWLKQCFSYSPTLKNKRSIKSLNGVTKQFSTAQRQCFDQLNHRYSLDDWAQLCNRTEFIENLYLLDLLDQHIGEVSVDEMVDGMGLDIGCRNFSHLPALSAFMPRRWAGVELDAHARYWNGFTRRAYGEWMVKQREECRYIAGSLLDVEGSFCMISWVLPFVSEAPLQRWGLPARFFQPQLLLEKACSLLASGGEMFVVNQGEREAEAQQKLFDAVQVKVETLGKIDSVFSPFKHSRYGWLVSH